MKLNDIDVNATIEKARKLLDEEQNISPAFKSVVEVLFLIVTILVNRLGLNSSNSSKPPSSDPNRKKGSRKKSGRKPGGQKGHKGSQLKPVENPDEIENIDIDRKTLPKGDYHEAGYTARQVIDIRISRHVIEYRAQILENENGVQSIF